MRLLVRLLVLGLLVLVGGCGASSSSSSSGGTDPAKLIPADAKVYVEAVVRPEGDAKDRMSAFVGKILRSDDPGAKIKELINDGIHENEPDASYENDIEPWLGERIGAGLTDFSADEPAFVVAIQARDTDAARKETERIAGENNAHKATYQGVDYWADSDTVAGVVEDAVVIAQTEAQFKRAVDASKGTSLADVKAFKDALADLPDERVGTLYLDLASLADLALADADPQGAAVLKPLLSSVKQAAAALLVDDDTAAIEAATAKPDENTPAAGTGLFSAPGLVREVPAGSWAAVGIPDLGKVAKTAVNTFGGAVGGAVVAQQLAQVGIDLDRDVYSWIGDVAMFVRGDSPGTSLDGGLLIEVLDKAKAAAAIPKLVGLAQSGGGIPIRPVKVEGASMAFQVAVPDAPFPVVIALGDDRAVIAAGEAAARDALAGSETIEDSGLYDRAKDATGGMDPSVVVDGPGLVKLLASAAAADPDFAKARPYLDMLDAAAVGSKEDGDIVRTRFAVKLR